MRRLSITCLGTFHVKVDGEEVIAFKTDKVRALLAYLTVETRRPHRRESLAGLLWSDQSQEKATHSLRQALTTLRKALGDDQSAQPFLWSSHEEVQFNPACTLWIDVTEFLKAVDAALYDPRHGTRPGCINILRLKKAVALYQGDFLQGCILSGSPAFDEWVTLRREAFSRKMIEAMTAIEEYHERRGELAAALEAVNRLIALTPWDETAHTQAMRLLAMQGQWGAAQAQYIACCRYLSDELGVDPSPETIALYEQIQRTAAQKRDFNARFPLPRQDLPSLSTPLVGREQQLEELAEWFAEPDCCLVTALGPGGIGKSRLALEFARLQVGLYPDGVYWIQFAPVSSTESIIPVMMQAIGLALSERDEPKQQLFNYLRDKKMFLVLDNWEHLHSASLLLAELLESAPLLAILVTSRQRLNLKEERVYDLHGLVSPPGQGHSLNELSQYEAVRLFYSSASRLRKDFSPDAEGQMAIASICRSLDGNPLGIELAAAATWQHTPQEIEKQIVCDLDFLVSSLQNIPERQRSLRKTFEYSWQWLSADEQRVFKRLSIFRGGFTMQAAASVSGADDRLMGALIDKSLLQHEPDGRYNFHEFLHQYAAEKLLNDPDDDRGTRERHASYYAMFGGLQGDIFHNRQSNQILLTISLELENIFQAWFWLIQNQRWQELEKLVDGLYPFFERTSRFREGLEWLNRLIDDLDEKIPEKLYAKALAYKGALNHRLGYLELARQYLEQGLAIFEQIGDVSGQVFNRINLVNTCQRMGNYDDAERLAHIALEQSRQTENDWGIIDALHLLGLIRYRNGEIGVARSYLEESLALARAVGDTRLILLPLNVLGDVFGHLGDYEQAQCAFEECLNLSEEMDDSYRKAIYLNNLGTIAHELKDYSRAHDLYQQSLEICRRVGDQEGQAIALSNLGEIAYLQGNLAEAEKLYRLGLMIGERIQDHWAIMSCMNNLGEVTASRQQLEQARRWFGRALKIANEIQTLPMALRILANLVNWYAQTGQRNMAAELCWHASHHPASEQDSRDKARRLQSRLDLELPAGPDAQLDQVIACVLQQLETPVHADLPATRPGTGK